MIMGYHEGRQLVMLEVIQALQEEAPDAPAAEEAGNNVLVSRKQPNLI